MKFAHLADCHLGSWRHPELQQLNTESFQKAIEICIKEKVDFVLVAGDLFDSAYPAIETIKTAFSEFKKLSDAKISVYVIAGSHDYSVSGKTFLDVLEIAGFCKIVSSPEEKGKNSETVKILNPTIIGNVAIFGYPGKKSGLEIAELEKIKLQDTPGLFKILMLHTTLTEARGNLPIDSISEAKLPKADYYALGHLHIDFNDGKHVYSGPIFPNNFEELEKLEHGTFYIIDTEQGIKKIDIKLKDVLSIEIKINNALTATEKIMEELKNLNINNKIFLLRLVGEIEKGKTTDINFQEIENWLKKNNVYIFLRNTSKLSTKESEIKIEVTNVEEIEKEIVKKFCQENPSKFNNHIEQLIDSLNAEKQEDEANIIFQNRIFEDFKKIINL